MDYVLFFNHSVIISGELMSDFNVASELLALKAQTKAIRNRKSINRVSRLDKFKFELLELYQAGASVAELQRWLMTNANIQIAHSTILRWLDKQENVK